MSRMTIDKLAAVILDHGVRLERLEKRRRL
jgi:hypothetical protein